MFDSLKKRLKKSVESLTKKVSAPPAKSKAAKPVKKPKLTRKPKLEKPAAKPSTRKPAKIEIASRRRETSLRHLAKGETQKPLEQPKEIPKPVEKAEAPKISEVPAEVPKEAPKEEKRGFFRKIREKVTEKALEEKDIDELFEESESELLQSNVALEVIDFLKEDLKKKLAGRQVKRSQAGEFIRKAFEEGLLEILDQGKINLEKLSKEKKPVTCVFIGFNGSGKTTTIARIAKYLQDRKLKPLLAAGDTFRAAAQEQLEHHGDKLKLKVIKHQYGADSAAVIYDAIRHAEGQGYDFVLADTAGRTHVDKNLADELKKVCRVNSPDLKILVVDSLTGNDAVEQAREFDKMAGVDAVVMTKVDVNTKGGSILSVCYAIKKPILFIGMGQGYDDLEAFSPQKFVKEILG